MAKVTHKDLRHGIVRTCREMNRIGLNQGTSGNLSHRIPDGLLITPTSLPYDEMGPKDIVEMALDGTYSGRHRPSSEWRFHRDILAARSDVNVVLHTHATYATTLAVHGRPIPAFHYMVAVAGGADVRCAPYACFGTQDLSDAALKALDGRLACLLGHHGLIVLADTFEKALWRAVEIETLAKMYVHALAIGEPPVLSSAQMALVMEQFRQMAYGQGTAKDSVATLSTARKSRGKQSSPPPANSAAAARLTKPRPKRLKPAAARTEAIAKPTPGRKSQRTRSTRV